MKRQLFGLLGRWWFALLAASPLVFSQEAASSLEEEGPSVQEFYGHLQEAVDDSDWWAVIDFGTIITEYFPGSLYESEMPFFIGLSYYRMGQHELANEILGNYLKSTSCAKHFEESVEMKFAIAEYFRQGGKKRLFGSHKLPAIIPAQEDALKIYEEVISALPHHELAVRALLGKAEVQAYLEDFKPSIETLQTLIRRFPKHELAAESYLRINQLYLCLCQTQHVDPALLDSAEINLQKFVAAFPREERVAGARTSIGEIKEIFARNLLETGNFFQRRKQMEASAMYFARVVSAYPDTKSAIVAQEKLSILRPADQGDEQHVR